MITVDVIVESSNSKYSKIYEFINKYDLMLYIAVLKAFSICILYSNFIVIGVSFYILYYNTKDINSKCYDTLLIAFIFFAIGRILICVLLYMKIKYRDTLDNFVLKRIDHILYTSIWFIIWCICIAMYVIDIKNCASYYEDIKVKNLYYIFVFDLFGVPIGIILFNIWFFSANLLLNLDSYNNRPVASIVNIDMPVAVAENIRTNRVVFLENE